MNSTKHCPHCHQPLPQDAPEGLCPACLAQTGLETQPATHATQPVDPPAPRGEMPKPGDAFGGYRIVRQLGHGGMGAVFEAEHVESGRRVALKVLGHELDSPEARARFLREGRLAASINHPNSVYVFGTEEIDGRPAIAMELIAGGTLQQRVQREGPLPVSAAVDAILQVIAGLEAAHAFGILHRDVKPANCFEDADGTIKVGDFGLSISTAAIGETNLTQHGTFLGTPAFSPPEHLRGETLTVRSDLYSVGITLYYLLTGRTPFAAENLVKLLADVLEQPAPSPRTFRPDLPPQLADVVLRCLQKEPGDRYRSYQELRQALAPFSSEAPVAAPLLLRFAAGFLDSVALGTIGTAIGLMTGVFGFASFLEVAPQMAPGFMRAIAIAFAAMLVYFTVLEGRWGATAGKALCRLRVIGPARTRPGMGRAFARALIYLVLPPLPYWLLFGMNPYAVIARSDHLTGQAISLVYYAMLALLFCTARRRNGLAAVHDLLTRTRVIRKPALVTRPLLAAPAETPPARDTQSVLGPYHVLEAIEQRADCTWLLGYDTRLLRKVWIHPLPAGTPMVTAALRNLGRIGRLRWITGRRSPTENWDAYEAATGQPLLKLISRPQAWAQVRFWVLDLAREISAAQKDGTLPALALDRVWITADGRAKLLDFPAPGLACGEAPTGGATSGEPPADVRPGAFLHQVSAAALLGRVPDRAAATPARLAIPLPLHAQRFLEQLPILADAEAITAALKPVVQQAVEVTRARRAALLGACLTVPIVAALAFVVAGRLVEQWQRRQPEIATLHQLLQQRSMAQMPWARHTGGPDEQKLAVYIASHYGAVITNASQWKTLYAITMIDAESREFAENSLARHPHPNADEIADATKAIEPFLPKKDSFDPLRMPWFPWIVAGMCLGTYVGLPALLAALLFRGGLLLRIVGLVVLRKNGERASRLRVFWRGLIAWSPAMILPFLSVALVPLFGSAGTAVIVVLLAGGLAAWSLALPERSLQDRLAGTWLVMR